MGETRASFGEWQSRRWRHGRGVFADSPPVAAGRYGAFATGHDAAGLAANPHVAEDSGRVAVLRGPLIYCMEQLDQPDGVTLSDAAIDLRRQTAAEFHSEFKSDLLGGVVVLRHPGAAYEGTSQGALYAPYTAATRKARAVPLTMIPYYAWANREPSFMEVWTPLLQG